MIYALSQHTLVVVFSLVQKPPERIFFSFLQSQSLLVTFSSSCFPRFILSPPVSAVRRLLFFSIVNGESRATDQKASGVDSTHTIDIASEVHGAATTNHQPPTTTTTRYHYLSAVQTGFLSFSSPQILPRFFFYSSPPALRDLTRLHTCPTTFTDRGRKLQAYDFLMMVDIEQSKSYAL